MCHCFTSLEDVSETEREEILTEHSIDELKAELSADELESLGIVA